MTALFTASRRSLRVMVAGGAVDAAGGGEGGADARGLGRVRAADGVEHHERGVVAEGREAVGVDVVASRYFCTKRAARRAVVAPSGAKPSEKKSPTSLSSSFCVREGSSSRRRRGSAR
jgi:hypothetical protein